MKLSKNFTLNKITDLVAIVPAYNEEANIKDVINQISKICPVIVLNDSSTDNTSKILTELDCITIENEKNLGYEQSLCVGIKHSLHLNFKYAITLDADGQLSPNYIPIFYELLDKEKFDLVIGCREKKQRYAEYIGGIMSHLIGGPKDPFCGLKGYNLKKVDVEILCSFRSFGTELSFRLIKTNNNWTQIPIKVQNRIGLSKFGDNGFKINYSMIRGLVKSLTIENEK